MSRPAPALRSRSDAELWRELVPLRPQGPVELVDRATLLFRSRFADLFGVAAMVQLPIWLLLALVLRDDWALGLSDGANALWNGFIPTPVAITTLLAQATSGGEATLAIGRVLPSVGLTVTGVACGRLLGGWARGEARRGPEALAWTARRAHHVAALWALVHLIEIVTCVGVVLGPLVLGITAPLMGMEGTGAITTVRRSIRLSLRQFIRVLGAVLVATIIAFVVAGVLSGLPVIVIASIAPNWTGLGGTSAVALLGALPHLVVDPLLATSMALLALDLRVRVEGTDVEDEMAQLGGAPA